MASDVSIIWFKKDHWVLIASHITKISHLVKIYVYIKMAEELLNVYVDWMFWKIGVVLVKIPWCQYSFWGGSVLYNIIKREDCSHCPQFICYNWWQQVHLCRKVLISDSIVWQSPFSCCHVVACKNVSNRKGFWKSWGSKLHFDEAKYCWGTLHCHMPWLCVFLLVGMDGVLVAAQD